MANGLNHTKRRIKSIASTKKITKAMELVATVKLKKSKDTMDNILEYLNTMERIIITLSSGNNDDSIIELEEFKDATSTLYLVVTSSLGLCGGYNYNVFKFLNSKITSNDKVVTIGTKGLTRFSHDNLDVEDEFVGILDHIDYLKVKNLINYLINEYRSGKYKRIVLISTMYKNSLTFIPTEYQLLPLKKREEKLTGETLFEPSRDEVLSLVIPKYLNTYLYGRLVEAGVCEQAARRNAMDSATDNAEELLDKLQIEYNKVRQGAITQEITEVVAGANN